MRFEYVRFFSFFKRKRLRTARGYTKNASSKHSKAANGGFYTPSASTGSSPRWNALQFAVINSTVLQTLIVHDIVPGFSITARGLWWVRAWSVGLRTTEK